MISYVYTGIDIYIKPAIITDSKRYIKWTHLYFKHYGRTLYQIDTHTSCDRKVRQGTQSQTPVSSPGSDNNAKVYSMTSVALSLQTRRHMHKHTHKPTDQRRDNGEGITKAGRWGRDGNKDMVVILMKSVS